MENAINSFLAIAPPIASFMCFISPYKTVAKMAQTQKTGDFPNLTFVSMAVMCSIWGTYGGLVHNSSVLITNIVGGLLSIYYLWVFEKNMESASKLADLHRLYKIGIFALLVILLKIYTSDTKSSVDFVGICGSVLSVIFTSSPLMSLPSIMRSKSTESMPIHISLMLFTSSLLWVLHGVFLAEDPSIYIPNTIGTTVAFIQICIHLVFYVGIIKPEATNNTATKTMVRQASI